MKSSSNLRFNTDPIALAELIPGSMDENSNFIVKEGMMESQLPVDKKTFEEMKENVIFVHDFNSRWILSYQNSLHCMFRMVN